MTHEVKHLLLVPCVSLARSLTRVQLDAHVEVSPTGSVPVKVAKPYVSTGKNETEGWIGRM